MKVWLPHLGMNTAKGKSESPLFHLSGKMSEIITEDITAKLEDLDFEKDPYNIVGELIASLQRFDLITERSTLNVLKSKLEIWLQMKLVSVREVVVRSYAFETWQPVSEVGIFDWLITF